MTGAEPIDKNPPTLAELLRYSAELLPEHTFAIFPEVSIGYRQLFLQARSLAKGLIAMGLSPRGHVAILMPNGVDFLLAHFAVQLAGGISVLLNARSRQQELTYAVPHCDAEFLLTTDAIDAHVDFARLLEDAFPELPDAGGDHDLRLTGVPRLRRAVLFGRKRWGAAMSVSSLIDRGLTVSDEALTARQTGHDAEESAVMIYTSGTTASPKACELSHAGLQRSWAIYARAVGLSQGEKVWDPMPFFHSGGIGLMTGIMACGATIVSSAHFDAEIIVDLVLRHRIEHLYPGFHALALPVMQSPRYNRRDFDFVRTMVVVGPLGTLRWIQSALPVHATVMNLFGMSEGSGLVTLTPPQASEERRLTTSGPAPAHVEVRIVNSETGETLPAESPGEIEFRGGGAFRAYYKDPEATRATILPGGWIRTGDLGKLDTDGWLHYLGRLKDMLKVGGENVAAVEIESFLSTHPAVKFVQVIGRPDRRMGEVPVAFVECNPGFSPPGQELIDLCIGKIARYKIPRDVIFVTQWPMSATKIQKFKLRELLPPDSADA
jgi:acyl-CoA synthetase (AMP-forming)/AMP-acid ligase II